MKAHSKFADLETQAAKTKSHFEQKRATYEQRIASLQQDLSAVKLQLKTHVQELVHFEEYGKRKADQVKELTEDKLKLKNELAKMKAKAESMIKQYRKENEQLKAQVIQIVCMLDKLSMVSFKRIVYGNYVCRYTSVLSKCMYTLCMRSITINSIMVAYLASML